MTQDRVAWGLAGLYQPDRPGHLERPLDGFYLFVPPHLRVEGEELRWQWRDGAEWLDPAHATKPGPGVLEQFVGLADGTSSDVLDYAGSWGNLWLCSCTRPFAHRPIHESVPDGLPSCAGPRAGDPFDWNDREPVEAWHRYARRAQAILRLVAAASGSQHDDDAWTRLLLSADGDSDLELWRHYTKDHINYCEPGGERSYSHSGVCKAVSHINCVCGVPRCYRHSLGDFEVGTAIDNWLADAGVRARFLWLTVDRPELFIGRDEGVLGEIALQLALVSARSDAIAFCSACSSPYAPTRRPATSKDNYCARCRDRGRWRAAQRRRRAASATASPLR